MNVARPTLRGGEAEAAARLREAAAAKKCWRCGCLRGSLEAIEDAVPRSERSAELDRAVADARSALGPVQYDCLGCRVCFPAVALKALEGGGGGGAAEPSQPRGGWPPRPGSYTVLRFQAPVAVCTLSDANLASALAGAAPEGLSIVGTMYTENLGIERLIENVIANPNIRSLVLCGGDARQTVGHLPGQSLLALVEGGIDRDRRIVGAPGRRPLLKNIEPAAVERFRRQVKVLDLIGTTEARDVLRAVERCAATGAGPFPDAPAAPHAQPIERIGGYLPRRMVADPAGYFVVHVDRVRGRLTLEHYRNDGILDAAISGGTAAELYVPAIERSLVSRLDHAAYLGRELARAEDSLASGRPYVQDGAPERPGRPGRSGCGCGPACGSGEV